MERRGSLGPMDEAFVRTVEPLSDTAERSLSNLPLEHDERVEKRRRSKLQAVRKIYQQAKKGAKVPFSALNKNRRARMS